MVASAIQKIMDLKENLTISVDGKTYWADNHKEVKPAKKKHPQYIGASTLSAIKQFAENVETIEEYPMFIHIVGPQHVQLQCENDEHGRRQLLVDACYQDTDFAFGRHYDLEDFMIKMQAQFVSNENTKALLMLLGNITGGEEQTQADDGITQIVKTKAGVALAGNTKVENPVYLMPRVTFPEIAQPERPFILRISGSQSKDVALFEADGGAWKLAARDSMMKWFATNLPDIPVVG